jgi:mannose-1-phosphate guanylyltransferase/mannose-6-phosphate isomerase
MGVQPVILCGGVGSRLAPLSTPDRPKQFLPLMSAQSMLVDTLDRALAVSAWAPLLIGSVDHAGFLKFGARDHRVVLEPTGRGTASALAAAAQLMDPADVMLVMPSDHHIKDLDALVVSVEVAVQRAEEGDLVCLGVEPTRADPNYGYIRFEDLGSPWHPVQLFVEKPDSAEAERLRAEGALWNSGMFAFKAGALMAAMLELQPGVVAATASALATAQRLAGAMLLGDAFGRSPAVSVDHGVMALARNVSVVGLDAGWSDVGSWEVLWEIGPKDASGSVVVEGVSLGPNRTVEVGLAAAVFEISGDTGGLRPR